MCTLAHWISTLGLLGRSSWLTDLGLELLHIALMQQLDLSFTLDVFLLQAAVLLLQLGVHAAEVHAGPAQLGDLDAELIVLVVGWLGGVWWGGGGGETGRW